MKKIVLRVVLGLLIGLLVSCGSTGKVDSNEYSELDSAISKAAEDIISKVPPNTKVALFNISRNESVLTEYVIEELSVILVSKAQLIILDRDNLDIIRAEHSFQLSGDVPDEDILSIARKSGATSVISCSITGEDNLKRLRVRTLEVETGRVQSLTSYPINKIPGVANTQPSKNEHNQQYDNLQKFIETAEAQIKLTYDYVKKIEICLGVIDEIDIFLDKSDDRKTIDSVLKTRSDWDNRAIEFDKIWERLTDELIDALTEKAQEVSIAQYSGYNVEDIQIIDLNLIRPDSISALMSLTFHVKMRGRFLGINTQQFKLTVRGSINMRDDTIEVYDGYTFGRI
jgi:hypothetical protein